MDTYGRNSTAIKRYPGEPEEAGCWAGNHQSLSAREMLSERGGGYLQESQRSLDERRGGCFACL